MPSTLYGIDEARAELLGAFAAWDWSSAYPLTYTGTTAPHLVPAFPPDIIPNIVQFVRDQQMGAIISVELVNADDTFRTLGSVYGPGAGTFTRYGTRLQVSFAVSVWADMQAGGPDLAQKLLTQAEGCIFFNRSRLYAYRALRCHSSREVYEDRPQLWRADLVVDGSGIISYDA